jgi:hypothetical protein
LVGSGREAPATTAKTMSTPKPPQPQNRRRRYQQEVDGPRRSREGGGGGAGACGAQHPPGGPAAAVDTAQGGVRRIVDPGSGCGGFASSVYSPSLSSSAFGRPQPGEGRTTGPGGCLGPAREGRSNSWYATQISVPVRRHQSYCWYLRSISTLSLRRYTAICESSNATPELDRSTTPEAGLAEISFRLGIKIRGRKKQRRRITWTDTGITLPRQVQSTAAFVDGCCV